MLTVACRYCGNELYYTLTGGGWNMVLREHDDTLTCLARTDGHSEHEPNPPLLVGNSIWLVKKFGGPEATKCIDGAITGAIVTGSVGATHEIGGDVAEESFATVVGLTERKAG